VLTYDSEDNNKTTKDNNSVWKDGVMEQQNCAACVAIYLFKLFSDRQNVL
jgi:hypothetical protein